MKYLFLIIILLGSTGCDTLQGAANGFNQDVHNISNPDKNGWDLIKKTDDWVNQNVW
jgi:hypothetical protein